VTIAPERPPVRKAHPMAAEALIREARRRQHRRYAAIVAVVLLVPGAAALAWGGWGATKSSPPGGSETGGNPLVIPTQSQLQAEMVADLFPTSAADFTKGDQFVSLTNALTVRRQARCLTQAGFPSSMRVIPPGTGAGDNVDFPDTRRISAHGFNYGSQQSGGGALVSTGDHLTGLKAHQFLQAKAFCLAAAVTVFAPLDTGIAASLSAAWQFGVMPSIDQSPAVTSALAGWSACLLRGGVRVTTIDQFFSYADRRSASGESSGARRRLGQLFGRCMSMPESIRVRLRVSARSAFLAGHEPEVRMLYALFNRIVRQ
jgi:hypothetical protein